MGRVCWGSPLLPFLCPFPSSSLVGVGEDMVFTDTVAELVLFSLVHREAFSLYTALPKRLLGFLLFFGCGQLHPRHWRIQTPVT